jgi:predicted nucleotidyltransferase
MSPLNLAALRAVADRLDRLQLDYVFVGGAVVNLLLDDAGFSPARPTEDIDVIIAVVTTKPYSEIEARLRALGFDHDMRTGAPLCRWGLGSLVVDIMPTEGKFLGLNTAWFKEALETATEREFGPIRLRVVSPVAFLATKYVAFLDRGGDDFYDSPDLEDMLTVIDGRGNIVEEVNNAPVALRGYLAEAARKLMANPDFLDALAGYLPADRASQQRLPLLRNKLVAIAALK